MGKNGKNFLRFIAVVLVVALLPVWNVLPLVARAEATTVKAPAVLENTTIHQTQVINENLMIRGQVVLADGTQLLVERGTVTIADGALLRGSVVLNGDDARLLIGGTVEGDVTALGSRSKVELGGTIKGTLTIGAHGVRVFNEHLERLQTHSTAVLEKLVLDGGGLAIVRGKVDTVEITAGNKTCLRTEDLRTKTMTVRSDAWTSLMGKSVVDEIFFYGDECTWEKHGYVASLGFYNETKVGAVYAYDGFFDQSDYSHVDKIYVYGKDVLYHLEVYNDIRESPTVGEMYIFGSQSNIMTRGNIEFCYLEKGLLQNHGHIGSLVMAGGTLWGEVGGYFGEDYDYCSIAGKYSHFYDNFIQLGGDANLGSKIPVKQAVLLGGQVEKNKLNGDKPLLSLDGKNLHKQKDLVEGDQVVTSGDVLTIEAPAYSALNLKLTGEGGVLVEEPGNRYTWVESNKAETILTRQTGTLRLVVVGKGDLSLNAALDSAVEVKVDLTYRHATAKKEKAQVDQLALSDKTLTLRKANGKVIDTIRTEDALYALPDTAQPGEKLILRIEGAADVSLTLDENRHAEVSYEYVEPGRYEGTPKDESRAHLYLYDAQGKFLREVFFSGGSYNTGALADGTYNALWIRGGVGGWMLPHLSDFKENGLKDGKHYRLETVKISAGNVICSSPNIPDEPTLQSPWLKSEGTSYSTALTTVTAGGLVMMTLRWDFSGSEWTEAVAKVEFPSGGQYVKESAVIGSKKAEVSWKDQVLQVPLKETSGTLRFYMEASEDQKEITSSAFVCFGSESPVAQYVGSARTVIAPLSIQAPALTAERTVVVNGFSLPFSVVGIYDNDRLVAWGTTDGNGGWCSEITLSSETDHVLTVRSEDGQAVSDPVKVKIAAGAPVLKCFTVDYIEHKVAKKVEIKGERFGLEPLRFAYEPGTDVTFTIELKNDDTLEGLTLVAEQNGHKERLEAKRISAGKWVIVSPMSEDRAFIPQWLYLEYTFRADALASVFKNTYAEVPVLQMLDYHMDLGGALTRYYPADPYFHDADVGFGAGWVTDYTIRAQITQENKQATVRIYTPNGERYFTGTASSLSEIAGYATAKIRNGTLTVTESDGTKLGFDKNGWLKSLEDPYGKKLELTYQGDFLQKVTDGESVLKLTYDKSGHVISADLDGVNVEYTYADGCLIRVEEGEDSVYYTYTSDGMPLLSGFRGSHQGDGTIRYDDLARPVMITLDEETTILNYKEDALEMTVAEGTVTYKLDNGAVTDIVTSDGTVMSTEATKDGAVLKILDGTKNIYQAEFDSRGNMLSEKDETSTLRYGYDKRGNLTSITDGAGKVTSYGYDKANEITSVTYADGTKEKWSYDKNGNLKSYTDRAGAETSYSYDKSGNLTTVKNPDGTKITSNYGVSEEGGYWLDLIRGEEYTNIYQDQYGTSYELDGRNFRIGNGDYRIYGMGEDGAVSLYEGQRMTGVETVDGDSLTAYTYDKSGRVTTETRGNGTVTHYSYDQNDNLTKLENRTADGKVLSSYVMTYDQLGNILTMTTAAGKWEYAYDAAFRLISSKSPEGVKTTYTYDAAGNRTSMTVDGKKTNYKINELNQIVSAGTVKYTYDKAGNLLSDGVNTYTWNKMGQLVGVTDGKTTTSYTYDLYGNRHTRTVNGETTTYHTMPTELSMVLGQTDKYGETVYYYGDGGLVAAQINGERVYYLYDPFGSVSEIVDHAGNVLCSFVYDEWGQVTAEKIASGNLAQAAAAQNLRRHARYGLTDEGNGLIHARARYVCTDTGSFISPDPAGQSYDLNLYRYAENNPVMYMDINGEDSFEYRSGDLGDYRKYYDAEKTKTWADKEIKRLNDYLNKFDIWNNTKNWWIKNVQPWIGHLKTWTTKIGDKIYTRLWRTALGAYLLEHLFANPTLYRMFGGLVQLISKHWVGILIVLVVIILILIFSPKAHADDEIPVPKQEDDPGDDDDPKIWDGPGTPGKVDVDPSGYVYEAVASNRLSGVTATVYWRSEDGTAVKWDAAEYDQINPQITDFLGQYAWYVPEGMWRVTYSLPGYEDTQTSWLPVPPPQTEVNVGMVSRQAPTVTHAARFADGIELTFSKYMDMDSVRKDITALDKTGKSIPVTVTPMNAEKMVDENREVASRFLVVCEGDVQKLTLSGNAKSYAGTAIKAVTVEPEEAYRLESLGLEEEYTLAADKTHTLKLKLKGEGGYETMNFTAEIMGGSCVENVKISVPDQKGTGELTLKATAPGRATLRIREARSGYTHTIQLVIVPQDK